MSDDQLKDGIKKDQESKSSAPGYVEEKVYKEVSGDMHRYKEKAKKLEAERNKLLADMEAKERADLESKQEFEKLYKQRDADYQSLLEEREQEKILLANSIKKSALKAELGGVAKDAYLNFARFEDIQVNDDGSINSESLREIANSFRQEHPELLAHTATANITSTASPINNGAMQQAKSTSDMSIEELKQQLLNLK